ncbi:hypothetical protein QRD40_21470 [Comamonas sp. Y6]|uniref:DUF4124 domain-containing protein n=1 Tax=Comamonas resistens TaxID=3046670 RepID=A0ABY8SXJ7_9BURK|nr:hypothetical protein [Comamonas resistens]MDL5038912.1 hypothetical protein [Comamonas resistens]WHS67769.1 hypothetical protein QMY55_11895 [Comamonas resistens]
MGQYDPEGWQRENPFTSGRNEMSILSKLIFTIALLLIAALAYRYQSEIWRFLIGPPVTVVPAPQRPVVQSPERTVVAPKINVPDESHAESTGQIYRCGNTYSNTPCEGGKQIAQPSGGPSSREIYLCKDFQGSLTWESVPCSANGRFMDRIARVPTNVSWEEQVAIARQQRDKAHAIAAEQVVPVARRSTASTPSECQVLEQRIRVLDAECQVNACGMDKLDSIRFARKEARDRQFRIGC